MTTVESSNASPHLKDLWNYLEKSIWVIKIDFPRGSNQHYQLATGFSSKVNGYIFTCAHIVQPIGYKRLSINISARRLDCSKFVDVKVIPYNQLDIAVLQVDPLNDWKYADLAEDGSIYAGQDVIIMGNFSDLVGSIAVVKVAFPCLNIAPFTYDPMDNEACYLYESRSSPSSTRQYRIMGEVYGLRRFQQNPSLYTYQQEIHPHIPIIQICSFLDAKGTVGSPIINAERKIVGIFMDREHGFGIAIHVTVLKAVISEIEKMLASHSTKIGDSKDWPKE